MYSVKVKADLCNRLDAEFYNPDALQVIAKIGRLGEVSTLGDEISEGYRVVYHGTDSVASLPETERLGFLSPTQISDEGDIDFEGMDQLPLYYREQYPKGLARPGELLIEVKGNVSKVCVVPDDFPKNLMISGSLYKSTLSKKLDPHYVLAFLKSKPGQILKNRLTSNTIINYIGKDDLYSIPILLINTLAQKYIGNKIRQAECLMKWARRLGSAPAIVEAVINGLVAEKDLVAAQVSLMNGVREQDREIHSRFEKWSFLGESEEGLGGLLQKCILGSVDSERERCHINRISASEVEDFLTAQTYRPEITQAYERLAGCGSEILQDVCVQPIRQGATPKFAERGSRCLKSKQTRDMIIDDIGFETVDPSDPDNKSIVRLVSGDVVITRQGAGTVGRASLFLGDVETYITDSLFIVRADKNKVDPGYLVAYLRSYTGKRLIEKGVYGSTGQLNLSASHVRNIPVASLDLLAQKYIGDKVRLVDSLKTYQRSLIRASKSIVEALIGGQLTEQQLTDAQKALGANDNSLDRDILSRLKTDGIDGEGEPLFPDLDQLYEVLEKANQELEA